nr:olfactory receptor 5F1-like [Zootoca vivipara]
MSTENTSVVSEFIFVGFADEPELKIPIFTLLLLIYGITVVGNLGMILLIRMDSRLHTPMYFFLSNLAFLDFCYSSNITPKALRTLLSERRTISFLGCLIQLYFFVALVSTECILFGLMAYDRYVAICNPLLYTSIMSHTRCIKMAGGAFTAGFLNSIIHTTLVVRLSFCGSNVINHFFCDIPPLLALSCSNTHFNEILLFALCGSIQMSTFVLIIISYASILCTILRIPSTDSRHKAFSTCTSHLTAVALFYGTLLFMYLRPSSSYAMDTDKIISVFYTVVFPMVNPLIYCLRNKEVKDALKRTLERHACCC